MKLPLALATILSLSSFAIPGANAAITWDADGATTGPQDGSGNWDNVTTNWWDGSTNVIARVGTANAGNGTFVSGNPTVSLANTSTLGVGMGVSASNGTPAGATILSIVPNTSFTMSANASAGTTQALTVGENVTVGAGSGAAGTITLLSAQQINNLTINAAGSGNYTFAGANLTLGGASATLAVNSSVTFNNILNAVNTNSGVNASIAAGQTLTLAKGGVVLAGNFTGATGTVAVTGGTTVVGNGTFNMGNPTTGAGGYQISGAGTSVSYSGGLQLGNTTSAFVSVGTGATLTVTGSGGQLSVGRNAAGNVGRLLVDGGTLNVSSTSTSPLMVGRANGTGTLQVQNNGTVTAAGVMQLSTDGGSGTLNISSGTVTAGTIAFHGTNAASGGAGTGSSTILMTGGGLYVGSGGIVDRSTNTAVTTYSVTLSGGTVGATADWSSDRNMTLATTNGNITFRAADAANTTSHNIVLSGVLSGSGGLTKDGAGSLTLNGVNTYTGLTQVNAGTLTLGSFSSISDTGSLGLANGSTLALNFATGSETVGSVFNSTTGTFVAPGTYDAATLMTALGGTVNVSSLGGTLTVTAVPEPSTWGLALAGFGLLAVVNKRRRK
jgi:hypothetical protein